MMSHANVLVVMLLACCAAAPAHAQKSEGQDSLQLIVTVSAAYDDSDSSRAQIQRLSELMPPTRLVKSGYATIPELILARYKVSDGHANEDRHDSDLPLTYKYLEDKIVCLNRLASATAQVPDTVFIPSVPQKAWHAGNSVFNKVPVILRPRVVHDEHVVGECGQLLPDVTLGAVWDTVRNDQSQGSQQARIEMWVTEQDFATLYDQYGSMLDDGLRVTVQAQAMPLARGVSPAPIPPERITLPASDAALIKGALATSAQRPVSLFILDTGWPNAVAYQSSIAYLRRLLDTTRYYLRLPRKHWSSVPEFKTPKDSHCVHIAEALRDLQALDPNKRVRVAFVPASRGQGSSELLIELVYLNRVIELKTAALSRIAGEAIADTITLPPSFLEDARQFAQRLVLGLPAETTPQSFVTDKTLLESLIYVASLVASKQNTLFFLNESWTVVKNGIRLAPPSPSWGLQVAAAGNATRNILDVEHPVDFAQRSLPATDVLAVLAMDNLGQRRCGSSMVQSESFDQVLAVGYDGWVSDGCGTSFAAPRVAWFFAVREVLRREPLDPRMMGHDLLKRLELHGARRVPEDLLFHPTLFLGLQQP